MDLNHLVNIKILNRILENIKRIIHHDKLFPSQESKIGLTVENQNKSPH